MGRAQVLTRYRDIRHAGPSVNPCVFLDSVDGTIYLSSRAYFALFWEALQGHVTMVQGQSQ